MHKTSDKAPRRSRGFFRASGLVESRIRKVGETRGFEVARLVTHWPEVVGADFARIARPVDVSYGRGSFGATLTVLTTGAKAPMLQMRLGELKERVNACYGYAAIRHIRITQTAPVGFAEGQAEFSPAPAQAPAAPDPAARQAASQAAAPVQDTALRRALEDLGTHVLSRNKQN
jgi:hypothetical protein